MSGPPPLPNELWQMRHGRIRQERRGAPQRVVSAEPPPTPERLSPLAREVYEDLQRQLQALGVWSDTDLLAVCHAAELEVLWRETLTAYQALPEDEKHLIRQAFERGGERVAPQPLLRELLAIADSLHRYLSALGLSPSARTRVTAPPKPDRNDSDELRVLRRMA